MIDFGDSSRNGAAYLAQAAQTPVAIAPQARPASQAATAAPIVVPQSAYDVAPSSVGGYAVAPRSKHSTPPVALKQYANLYAPQPLPPRLDGSRAAPVPQQPYLAPVPPKPAVSTKYGRTPPLAKRATKQTPDETQGQDKDETTESDANNEEKKEAPPHIAIDVSMGGTSRKSLTANTGVTAAVGGHLEESGLRAHVAFQAQFGCCIGAPKNSPRPQGVTLTNTVLAGYEAVGEKGTIAGYVGANVENMPVASVDGVSPATRTTAVGAQVALDVYYTPSEQIVMSSSLSFSTRRLSYFSRTKVGYAVQEELYIGPEF